MQVSVQTDRKKKELAPVVTAVEGEGEDQKERQRRIKKLTLINRELIETLKRQNEQLTKKINRQKLKVGRSVERAESPGRNLQKEKKELANAYKQIEMYKNVLKDLKAKEISTESADKLSQLENRIRCEDGTIDKLQKELRYVRNIRDQQQKELHLYENQDVKASVGQLEDELKQLKERLKQAKKQAKKREEVALKQHAYFIELEKTLRKQNDQYYPGLTARPKKERPPDNDNITEREWQVVRAQLAELKKTHQENNKKIQALTRLRNKELKSYEDNELRSKDKQRRLATLKAKLAELAKLVVVEEQPARSARRESEVEGGEGYEETIVNGKKVFRAKDSATEREVKRWIIPVGYVQEKGKILPDSTFFSDKAQLRNTKKSKIVKVHVWSDGAGWPALCQFFYHSDEGKVVAGIIPFALGELQGLEDRFIEYKEGDYLAKLQGKIHDGIITSLTFVSKFGKKETFNAGALGEDWRFEPRPNEIPTCMFGSTVRDASDRIRLCYIGCEFIEDW